MRPRALAKHAVGQAGAKCADLGSVWEGGGWGRRGGVGKVAAWWSELRIPDPLPIQSPHPTHWFTPLLKRRRPTWPSLPHTSRRPTFRQRDVPQGCRTHTEALPPLRRPLPGGRDAARQAFGLGGHAGRQTECYAAQRSAITSAMHHTLEWSPTITMSAYCVFADVLQASTFAFSSMVQHPPH